MCGIFGLICKDDKPVPPNILEDALRLLAHRGPDGQGTFRDGALGLAHRRLAIYDLSDGGRQPMAYLHYLIVFNGAIYNFPELREELRQHGYTFRTNTDTEVITAAYDYWGKDCVNRFNGMWAFTIYDRRKGELFCCRDRFGIRPFYYLHNEHYFAFASEIKAFGALPGFRFKLNRQRAYEFLAYGWQAHTEECMVRELRQLPAACSAIFCIQSKKLTIERYYKLEENIAFSEEKTFESRRAQFLALLTDSIRLRLRADVPIALSLSGGMDSSSVLALQSQLQNKPLDCFSVLFPGTVGDETPFVDAVAGMYHPNLRKFTPNFEETMAALDDTCWYQDEPIASAAVIAHARMMQHIRRQGFKVMLNGQGADEILAGYDKFYWPFFKELAQSRPWQLPAEVAGFLRHTPPPIGDAWRRFQRSRPAPEAPGWLQPDFIPSTEQRFIRSRDKDVTSCSRNLIREVGLPVLLHYEDRNAMAYGIESRLPFMDHRLVEFSLGLPAGDKICYGIRKYMLRNAMKGLLPKSVLQRYTKMGFPTPQVEWMAQYSELFLERLKEATQNSDIFTGDLPGIAKRALEKREIAFYPVIWRAVVFDIWYRQFDIHTSPRSSFE